ncbi:MAG TPA: GTPase HflX, partial [Thermodesulfovibrionales bacterium]|nr:GTPase HflX [Thermodesulfovibrionales bacterium]
FRLNPLYKTFFCDRIHTKRNKEDIRIPSIYGNTSGLKGSDVHSLERIYRRRVPQDKVITPELARYLAELSSRIGRQIGLLISRSGNISHVIVGDTKGILIPDLSIYPIGRKALRGLRLVHTHMMDDPLNQDDLTDLSLLRLDLVAAIGIRDFLPDRIFIAHLMPQGSEKNIEVLPAQGFHQLDMDFILFIDSLEEEMERRRTFDQKDGRERAILVGVSTRPRYEQEDSMEELVELALSSGVLVLDRVIQRPKEVNPKYLMGEGKIKELIINAMNKGATLLIFDQDLNPSQTRALGELAELKVIDRCQLILDIFAQRAHSRDGKVQVELAQLKYRLPRLTGKGTSMSRLMGGIGGRGPGEMKLEIDRRRVRDRISLLEKELKALSEARKQRKQRRVATGIPIVSIIGYTNAGKSTLLNALTKSETFVEDKMFATLDTASRRLRFPREREIIITDTVGFIRDLPKDLMAAFKSTLEELEDADLLIHLVDASSPRFEQHIASVGKMLEDLGLKEKPQLLVFNKADRLQREEVDNLKVRFQAVAVSALDPSTFAPLLEAIEDSVWNDKIAAASV